MKVLIHLLGVKSDPVVTNPPPSQLSFPQMRPIEFLIELFCFKIE